MPYQSTTTIMKRLLLSLNLLLVSFYSFAQYSFAVSSSTYSELTNPTSLNNNTSWDRDSNYTIPFNFNFAIHGQTYTSLNLIAGGGISFQGQKELRVLSHPDSGYLLGDKDSSVSQSPISYEIIGRAGQQILKMQWKNAGFREFCASSIPNDSINFQIWLYEGTNSIEVHFGSSFSTLGSYGNPDCNTGVNGTQFLLRYDNCNNALSLTGLSNTPSFGFRNHCIWQP